MNYPAGSGPSVQVYTLEHRIAFEISTVGMCKSPPPPAPANFHFCHSIILLCVSITGFGQYLLLMPVITGMEAIRLRMRENAICARTLRAATVRMLAPHAARIMSRANDSSSAVLTQDGFLDGLSKVSRLRDVS